MAKEKKYIRGFYNQKRNTKYNYDYLNVAIHVQDLLDGLRSGEIKVTDGGYIPFDILPKQDTTKSTHYGVQTQDTDSDYLKNRVEPVEEEDQPF